MPSITDSQWQAIRRTAAAVAREAADQRNANLERTVATLVEQMRTMGLRFSGLDEDVTNLATMVGDLQPEPTVARPLNMQLKLYGRTAAIQVSAHGESLMVEQFDDLGRFIGADELAPAPDGEMMRNVKVDVNLAMPPTENHDPVFQAHLRTQRNMKKPVVSAPHPEFREGAKAPPSLPVSEFFIIGDAACYPYGGSPTRNLPYLVESPGQVMHGSEEQAWAEAQRLSKEHGRPYVVLKGIGTVTPTSVPSTFNTKF